MPFSANSRNAVVASFAVPSKPCIGLISCTGRPHWRTIDARRRLRHRRSRRSKTLILGPVNAGPGEFWPLYRVKIMRCNINFCSAAFWPNAPEPRRRLATERPAPDPKIKTSASRLRRRRLHRELGCRLAELLRLLRQFLHLRLDEL